MKPVRVCLLALCSSIAVVGCGAAHNGTVADTSPTNANSNNISISVTPPTANVTIGQTVQFSATVTNSSNTAVNWLVNGAAVGNASLGTISPAGLYTAPGRVSSGSISISATSVADPTKSASASVSVLGFSGMLSYHNDEGITGQNLNETVLTPANVNQNLFGKLFSYALDGQSFTQPLYVSNVPIPGQGTHNVVFLGTEHDTVYAFDADGLTQTPLWSANFTNPMAGISTIPATDVGGGLGPILPEIGITGTPVIDGSSGTLYVVAATNATGKEKFSGPVVIQASVPGSGWGSVNGQIAFQTLFELPRCALALVNGMVYIAWASYNDLGLYHGWILGYDASTLQQVTTWNSTPNGQKGGIWLSGASLSADSSGNIFAIVGNGTFDANTGGNDYGDTFLKLTPQGNTFSVSDYFTPFDQLALANGDIDVGSSGLTLLPDQPGPVSHLAVSAGKAGKIYLLNRDNMGKFQLGSDSQIVQFLPGALGTSTTDNDFSTATYWQGNVYFIANGDVMKQFKLTNGLLSAAPVAKGTHVYGYPGANMSVSANGANNGIVWSIEASGVNVLHAYDATNIAREIYNSNQAGGRDQFGAATRFSVPTVMSGKVFVAGQTELAVFGLL